MKDQTSTTISKVFLWLSGRESAQATSLKWRRFLANNTSKEKKSKSSSTPSNSNSSLSWEDSMANNKCWTSLLKNSISSLMITQIWEKMIKQRKNYTNVWTFCQMNFGRLLKRERSRPLKNAKRSWKVVGLNTHWSIWLHVLNKWCKVRSISSREPYSSSMITIMPLMRSSSLRHQNQTQLISLLKIKSFQMLKNYQKVLNQQTSTFTHTQDLMTSSRRHSKHKSSQMFSLTKDPSMPERKVARRKHQRRTRTRRKPSQNRSMLKRWRRQSRLKSQSWDSDFLK